MYMSFFFCKQKTAYEMDGAEGAQLLGRPFDHARDEAAPAGVDHADGAGAEECDRRTVGRENGERRAGLGRDGRIRLGPGVLTSLGDPYDTRAVDLVEPRPGQRTDDPPPALDVRRHLG